MAERKVQLRFIANTTQWKRAMGRVQRDLGQISRRLNKLTAIGAVVAAGARTFGLAAARVFIPVERAISRAGAAMGKTGAALKPLRDEIKKVGRESEASTRDVARAAEEYGRAGRSMVETMALLKPTADLAVIGNIDVAEAADKVTKTLKAFKLPAEQATQVIDGMVVAMENSTAGMNDLAQIASYAGGSMTLLGQDMATTLAIGGKMSDTLGDQTPRALNQLALQLFNNREKLKEFGVEVFNADGSARSFIHIIGDFQRATAHMSAEQRAATIDLVQGSIAMRGLNAAMNTSAADLDSLAEKIRNADGAAQRWIRILGEDTLGKLKNLANTLESLAISVGEHLKPRLDAAIQSVAAFLKKLSPEKIIEWTRRLAGWGETLVRFWVGAKVAGAVLGVAQAVNTLRIAFAGGTIAAKKFWTAATFGIGALVMYLPEIIAGVRKLKNALAPGADEGIEQSAKFQADYGRARKAHAERYGGRGATLDDRGFVHTADGRNLGSAGGWNDRRWRRRWQAANPNWADHMPAAGAAHDQRAAASRRGISGLAASREQEAAAAAAAAEAAAATTDQQPATGPAGAQWSGARSAGPLAGATADDRARADAERDARELARYRDYLNDRLETERQFRDEERNLADAYDEALRITDADKRAAALALVGEQRAALRDARAVADETDAQLRAEAEEWAREHRLTLNEEELEMLEEHLAAVKEAKDAARQQEFTDMVDAKMKEKKWAQMSDKEKLKWLKNVAAEELAILDKGGKLQSARKKAIKLRELGMSLASDPQEAYATTSKMFGWPLGPALGAAHAALVAAAILKGMKDVSGMAAGGWVGGAGPTDSQMRMLSPDEFVAPRATAQQIIDARAREMAAQRDDDIDHIDDAPLEVNLLLDGHQVAQALVPEFVRRNAGGF